MHFPFPISSTLEAKCKTLEQVLSPHSRVGIAYSGGTDSTFLAWFALKLLEKEVFAFLVVTPLLSVRERQNALATALEIGVQPELIELDPLSIPNVRENSPRRCYFCKKEIMGRVKKRAEEGGCTIVLDGTHAGDLTGYRPGKQALMELGIISPLALAGFTKEEVRELSRLAGLPTWNKPSQSCLATRIPYGTTLTREVLSKVEEAETCLRDLGLKELRVRLHGDLARIEIPLNAFPRLLESVNRERVVTKFREIGFLHVTLDLAGLRSGSWDEGLNS
jgi:pyridinium-3,5-biscarboxylic acid mononucleotide sulfurtransferase